MAALITADSDVPEEKFVQFSNSARPAWEPAQSQQLEDVAKEYDELYYIYYQDPAFDVKSERDARQQHVGLDGLNIPLYDAGEL